MPNRLRHDELETFHHVTNRGARRDLIFFDDLDRRRWLNLLADVCDARRAEIHGYCLMGNHFHLLLRTDGNLGHVMRDHGSRYVRSFNRRHALDGPLHRARYFNNPVTSDEQFRATTRYIHRNPTDAGLGPAEAFRWSSLRHFLAPRRPPSWLCVDFTLAMFDHDRDRYRSFVVGATLGARLGQTPSAPASDPVDSVWEVVRVVSAITEVDPNQLLRGTPGVRSPGRLAICLLASELGIAGSEVAQALDYAGPSSVGQAAKRAANLVERDPAFARILASARRSLACTQHVLADAA